MATLVYRDETPVRNWRKSSYSGGGNDCVEIAFGTSNAGLRDSKDVTSGALWCTAEVWHALRHSARGQ